MDATISSDLRLRRILANLLQFEVAQHLGITQSRLSEFELGKRTPTPEMAQNIKEAINQLAETERGRR